MPTYIHFGLLLDSVEMGYKKSCNLNSISNFKMLKNTENPNYDIIVNKDGKYDWRKLTIIHPYLYIDLVYMITEKDNWNFIVKKLNEYKMDNIICTSYPGKSTSLRSNKAETILDWWQDNEQDAIRLSLDYSLCMHLDIANCYGSIYTHTIVWALHGKDTAKNSRGKKWNKKILGDKIDYKICNMQHGQTNGIL